MMRTPLPHALLIAALVSACNASPPDIKRWNNSQTLPVTPPGAISPASDDLPRLLVYAAPPPSNAGNGGGSGFKLRDLSDHGQAAYIAAAESKAATLGDLKDSLGATFGSGGGDGIGSLDWTQFDRTLVFSVASSANYYPADRLVRVAITVIPDDFYFAGYTIAATDTQTVNIGTIDRKVENTASADFNPTLSGFIKGPIDLKAGTDRTTDVSTSLSVQRENLAIDIRPDRMTIYREGDRGINLAGNVLLKATLAATPAKLLGADQYFLMATSLDLYKDGRPRSPKDAKIGLATLHTLPIQGLTASATFQFVLRRVSGKGADTYDESDDDVTFISKKLMAEGTDANGKITLAIPTEERRALRGIRNGDGCYAMIQPTPTLRLPLVFADAEQAVQMQSWMSATQATSIGTPAIPLTFAPCPAGGSYPMLVVDKVD